MLRSYPGGVLIVHQHRKVSIVTQVYRAQLCEAKDVHHQAENHVARESAARRRRGNELVEMIIRP